MKDKEYTCSATFPFPAVVELGIFAVESSQKSINRWRFNYTHISTLFVLFSVGRLNGYLLFVCKKCHIYLQCHCNFKYNMGIYSLLHLCPIAESNLFQVSDVEKLLCFISKFLSAGV